MIIKDVSIKILGGKGQIGGNIIMLEYQGTKILLDIGMPLEGTGASIQANNDIPVLSDIDYCLITHAHLDHWGYMDLLPDPCVIYSGKVTQSLIYISRFITHRPLIYNHWRNFRTNEPFYLQAFTITPFLIDHSAYDAHAFLIQVGGVNIFYTGDIRFHGRKKSLSLNLISKLNSIPIDLLISEGTNLSKPLIGEKTEADLEDDFVRVFSNNNHPAIVQMSGQNIDRLVTVFRACQKTDRMLVLDPYTAFVVSRIYNRNIPHLGKYWGISVLMPENEKLWESLGILAKKVDWMSTEALDFDDLRQFQHYVLIYRYWIGQELSNQDVFPKGSDFIYSMSRYYLDTMKQQWGSLAPRIESGDVNFHVLHVSGHAYPDDLLDFIYGMDPRHILPVHTVAPEWFQQFGEKLVNEGAVIE